MKIILLCLFLSGFAEARTFDFNLIGGRPATKGEYPETVYISSGNARCSASVIGPRVIMTAGHCVADDGQIGPVAVSNTVAFSIDKTSYTAKCKQAPMYRDHTEDHDMALCKVDKAVSIKPGSISKKGPQLGEKVILSGYGCVKPGGGGGNDGILRIGKAKVIKLPEGKDHWFYVQDTAALCFGDSGGPSFLDSKEHLIIGVNSRGNIKDLSLLTAVYTQESLDFFEEFAKDQEVEICGITTDCDQK